MSNNDKQLHGISVVIPVLNAAEYLPALLEALQEQKPSAPAEVILVDSCSTDNTREIAALHPSVRVIPIENFSHGRARNLGVRAATGDIVVLMTQDATPSDSAWLANLVEPLGRDNVVATYSRQIPRSTASPMERFYLQTNFPDGLPVRRPKEITANPDLTDVLFSNVSAAIVREILLAHPFDEELIMCEDRQFAKEIYMAGYATVYQPSSVVIHSHNHPLSVVFKRYFDSVYAIQQMLSDYEMKNSVSFGIGYLWNEMRYITRHAPLTLPYYALFVLAKVTGVIAGHAAKYLPQSIRRRLSLHRYHWE